MRCYHFCNMYLGGIAAGIQSAHAQTRMVLKYRNEDTPAARMLFDWATNHETMILLNGGESGHLQELLAFLSSDSNTSYPFAPFNESQSALNGALTNIALVLPERIYAHSKLIKLLDDVARYPDKAARYALTFDMTDTEHMVTYKPDGGDETLEYSMFDIELMRWMAKMGLMR